MRLFFPVASEDFANCTYTIEVDTDVREITSDAPVLTPESFAGRMYCLYIVTAKDGMVRKV